MRERPILFNAEMVRAVLDGRKTQTRRVIKPQPPAHLEDPHQLGGKWVVTENEPPDTLTNYPVPCPYGEPGDVLYVKETWALASEHNALRPSEVSAGALVWYRANQESTQRGRWRSPRFMVRWASRIQREVTEVRVERVMDISHADILAEGVRCPEHDALRPAAAVARESSCPGCPRLEAAWVTLWDSINETRGVGSIANPWVWAVSFRRMT